MKLKMVSNLEEMNTNDIIYLRSLPYDDYGYDTTFEMRIKKENELIYIGIVKVGCFNLYSKVPHDTSQGGYPSCSVSLSLKNSEITNLEDDYFSLGQDISYYKNIVSNFPSQDKEIFMIMKDLASDLDRFYELYNNGTQILKDSLLRNIHTVNVKQFSRYVNNEDELTPYDITFNYYEQELKIKVQPNSFPPSNIHVVIGRNGVGKTWLLYQILQKLLLNSNIPVEFCGSDKYKVDDEFTFEGEDESFAGIIGISHSIFDDALCLLPKEEQSKGEVTSKQIDDFRKKYQYIGLVHKTLIKNKNIQNDNSRNTDSEVMDDEILSIGQVLNGESLAGLLTENPNKNGLIDKTEYINTTKDIDELKNEFINAIVELKKDQNKVKLYIETCDNLGNDPMFTENKFIELLKWYLTRDQYLLENKKITKSRVEGAIMKQFGRLSSGHMIIMLSITLLTKCIYEKSIILLDEPETHLHPPLLSTYIRSLSFLLSKRNAVAIIATHSPIVLQEVPKSCVTRLERDRDGMKFDVLPIETFATSVDTLTREVFALELFETGFYKMIKDVSEKTFEYTYYDKFKEQVGFLGQVLIQNALFEEGDLVEED